MLRAVLRSPSGVIGLIAVTALVLVAIFAPPLLGDRASEYNLLHANLGPTAGHPLGTDQLGRDIFTRVIVATRTSIGLAALAAAIAAIGGTFFGLLAVAVHPRVRSVPLRFFDLMLAFPPILIAIFVVAVAGPGPAHAAIAVGVALSFQGARISSALTLSVAGREYVAAARLARVGRVRLMIRYVLANIVDTLIVIVALSMTSGLLFVSSLSFLGLGVQSPQYDWGKLLTEGIAAFYTRPAAALGPAVAIVIASLAFSLTGEALARAANPTAWTRSRRDSRHAEPAHDAPRIAEEPAALAVVPVPLLLRVRDLVVGFGSRRDRFLAVRGISFDMKYGEIVGLVGETGSGKTLTALAIADLLPASADREGVVEFDGRDTSQLSRRERNKLMGLELASVFQDPSSSLNPALRLRRQLTERSQVHQGMSRKSATARAVEKLRSVGLPEPERQIHRYPAELSGGMRQRATIAMGLMGEPKLIIADEPTTALDVTTQAQVVDVFKELAAGGIGILFISHNLPLVTHLCDRVMVMYAGRLVEAASVEQLAAGARHPYTRMLLGVIPSISRPRSTPLETIGGQPPDPRSVPSGCAFHPRCPLAIGKCATETPPLIAAPDGSSVACWVTAAEEAA
jgi:oligopeptide/dipeptide ABC transporter ATP-binding protein